MSCLQLTTLTFRWLGIRTFLNHDKTSLEQHERVTSGVPVFLAADLLYVLAFSFCSWLSFRCLYHLQLTTPTLRWLGIRTFVNRDKTSLGQHERATSVVTVLIDAD